MKGHRPAAANIDDIQTIPQGIHWGVMKDLHKAARTSSANDRAACPGTPTLGARSDPATAMTAAISPCREQDEQTAQAILEAITEAVLLLDRDGTVLLANEKGGQHFGLVTAQQLIGRNIYALLGPHAATAAREHVEKALASCRPVRFEAEQAARHFAYSLFPVAAADGLPSRIAIYCADVTERKRGELELRRSERHYRMVFEHAQDLVATLTPEGIVSSLNPAFESITGWKASDWIGHPWARLLAPHESASMPDWLHRVVAGVALPPWEVQLRTGLGDNTATLELTAVAMREDDGTVTSVLIVGRDVTPRRRQQQLQREKEAAEAKSRAKSEFLANMSHELRTPMNGVLGALGILRNTELNARQREFVDLAAASADSLLRLLDDILDFSKIEAGKMQIDPRPFRLREHLADTLKTLALQARARGLEFNLHVGPKVPDALVGDDGRLAQIILNLVSNAIKFTAQGEVLVSCDVISQLDDQVQLRFAVRDTGIGIAEDKRELIFQSFTQADGSTTRRFGGTGLGLTIAAELVRMMGGTLWLQSTLGQGSTFAFTVRLTRQPAARAPAESDQHSLLAGCRALVVAAHDTSQRVLADTLRAWDMDVACARHPLAALEKLRSVADSNRYLLVVAESSDALDAFQLAGRIRYEPALYGTVVVVTVSGQSPLSPEQACDLGIAGVLQKPIKQSELLDVVLGALGVGARPKRSSAIPPPEFPPLQRSLHILLAEDNPVNQRLAVALLQDRGHRVQVVGSGREAVEAAKHQQFDLILMDIGMPEMDGLQATAAIRRLQPQRDGPRTPIYALTAHAMQGDRERFLDAGMDGYIPKPVRPHELLATIEGWRAHAEQKTSSEQPDFDPEAALGYVGGRRELLLEIAQMFVHESSRMLDDIERAVREGDALRIERASHSLKSAVSHLGALPTWNHARALEELGHSGDLASARGLWPAVRDSVHRLNDALRALGNGST